jgi:hypothetical protein
MEQDQKVTIQQKIANVAANIRMLMQSNPKVFFGILGCVVLSIVFIITGALFFSHQVSNDTTNALPPEVSTSGNSSLPSLPSFRKTTPAVLSLVLKDKKKSYHVNDQITLLLIGETNGQTIRGYDAVFKFDKNIVSYISSKNLFSSFAYQIRPTGNWLMVTGAQSMDSHTTKTFKNQNLMIIHFKAVKPGVAYFPMSFVEGRLSDSNLIDEKSHDILTSVHGLTVRIIK